MLYVHFDTSELEHDAEFMRLITNFAFARTELISYLEHATELTIRPDYTPENESTPDRLI